MTTMRKCNCGYHMPGREMKSDHTRSDGDACLMPNVSTIHPKHYRDISGNEERSHLEWSATLVTVPSSLVVI